jgi:hypothetical protein
LDRSRFERLANGVGYRLVMRRMGDENVARHRGPSRPVLLVPRRTGNGII